MEQLFKDFDISTNSIAFFNVGLSEDGKLNYTLTGHEEEANKIYLTHKATGKDLEVTSNGDDSVLKDLNQIWIDMNGDIDGFIEKYHEEW